MLNKNNNNNEKYEVFISSQSNQWGFASFIFYCISALAASIFIWGAWNYYSASSQWVRSANSLFGALSGTMRNRELMPIVTRAIYTMELSGPVAIISLFLGAISSLKGKRKNNNRI